MGLRTEPRSFLLLGGRWRREASKKARLFEGVRRKTELKVRMANTFKCPGKSKGDTAGFVEEVIN